MTALAETPVPPRDEDLRLLRARIAALESLARELISEFVPLDEQSRRYHAPAAVRSEVYERWRRELGDRRD